mmetsp:Transcript_15898/g.24508  ORF Transcript_15898/g.24508 Transcript_15898/m.24508 type:complete len:92 (+) Transcript_15898:3215-3490(+)
MRSDFGTVDKDEDPKEDSSEDQFYKRMQKCFTSNSFNAKPKGSTDVVDNEERDIKSEAYQHPSNQDADLNQGLMQSLAADFSGPIGTKQRR